MPDVKPGYTTTEFWVTVLTVVAGLLATFFGHDWGLSSSLQTVAPIAAAIAGAVYTWARAHTKAKASVASAQVASARVYTPTYTTSVGQTYNARQQVEVDPPATSP